MFTITVYFKVSFFFFSAALHNLFNVESTASICIEMCNIIKTNRIEKIFTKFTYRTISKQYPIVLPIEFSYVMYQLCNDVTDIVVFAHFVHLAVVVVVVDDLAFIRRFKFNFEHKSCILRDNISVGCSRITLVKVIDGD